MASVERGAVSGPPAEVARRYVVFGRVVRERREELGLTQAEIQSYLGKSETYMSLVESGKLQPRAKTLAKLAEKLELHYGYLAPLCGMMPWPETGEPRPRRAGLLGVIKHLSDEELGRAEKVLRVMFSKQVPKQRAEGDGKHER